MSEQKHTVLNCTDDPQPCEYCGATVPPNSDHECEERPAMTDNLTPFERAVEVVKSPEVCPWLNLKQEQALINEVTTALQAQSNADEARHREKQQALRNLLAQQTQRADAAEQGRLRHQFIVEDGTSYHPEFCPVTGRSFFMTIEGEDGRMVATYGGPFDSYTIPEWNGEDNEFRSERFDHDAGHWVDGGEPYDFILVDEQEYHGIVAERNAAIAAKNAAEGKWAAKFDDQMGHFSRRLDSIAKKRDAALAHAAELRRALEECAECLEDALGRLSCPVESQNHRGNKADADSFGGCSALKEASAALALTPGEALAKVRREAAADAIKAAAMDLDMACSLHGSDPGFTVEIHTPDGTMKARESVSDWLHNRAAELRKEGR